MAKLPLASVTRGAGRGAASAALLCAGTALLRAALRQPLSSAPRACCQQRAGIGALFLFSPDLLAPLPITGSAQLGKWELKFLFCFMKITRLAEQLPLLDITYSVVVVIAVEESSSTSSSRTGSSGLIQRHPLQLSSDK